MSHFHECEGILNQNSAECARRQKKKSVTAEFLKTDGSIRFSDKKTFRSDKTSVYFILWSDKTCWMSEMWVGDSISLRQMVKVTPMWCFAWLVPQKLVYLSVCSPQKLEPGPSLAFGTHEPLKWYNAMTLPSTYFEVKFLPKCGALSRCPLVTLVKRCSNAWVKII